MGYNVAIDGRQEPEKARSQKLVAKEKGYICVDIRGNVQRPCNSFPG